MKKAIYIIAFILAAITTNAQITLENSYTAPALKMVNLSVSGYKYCTYDWTSTSPVQVNLYNLNHSLWKTINCAFSPGGFFEGSIVVSEELFNTDNLVEVLYTVSYANRDTVYIVNETGSTVFSTETVWATTYGQIVNDGVNFKLVTQNSANTQSNVYSLPGTLPCNLCGGFSTGMVTQNSNGIEKMISNPYPNPTTDRTTINYELPENVNQGKIVFYDVTGNAVKEFNVDRSFKDLQVSGADLSAGTYYYQLQTIKGTSGGKKLIVIK